jgi:hypothetical protein
MAVAKNGAVVTVGAPENRGVLSATAVGLGASPQLVSIRESTARGRMRCMGSPDLEVFD